MKLFVLLAIIIALASTETITGFDADGVRMITDSNPNGFELIGVYSTSNGCNPYVCPNTNTMTAQPFTCPNYGLNQGQISYSGGVYSFNLFTNPAYSYNPGYITQTFTQQDIVGNSQIQIPLQGGYVLNMQPCWNGSSLISTECPTTPSEYQRTMLAWKSYNGASVNGCTFLLRNDSVTSNEEVEEQFEEVPETNEEVPVTNGFELIGVYSTSNGCNPYVCPNTNTMTAQPFTCPNYGLNQGQISYSGGVYSFNLYTNPAYQYNPGFITQTFTQQDIVGNSQIQIPLQGGYVLNMQPCWNGSSLISSECPTTPSEYQRTMLAWKSYNGASVNGCTFLLRNDSV